MSKINSNINYRIFVQVQNHLMSTVSNIVILKHFIKNNELITPIILLDKLYGTLLRSGNSKLFVS